MHNYKKLEIWKKGMKITSEVIQLINNLPPEHKFGLYQQILRCAVSVPSNIAEGSARKSSKEFAHYLSISLGSLFELETQLIILNDSIYEIDNKILVDVNELQKMTYAFIKRIRNSSV
ncbi:four helix bundle protein [Paracrocinitomix mangrovi]|uniref:four helix bundle protein n=1 Tax=Paracrocinitomix mangrovi TaxID=2862509 RepID=UPI001C8EDC34|nr:four helix bundle protein [Paracrocinitomix mangrovi]UKN01328.1 four helix bundle protein [Paracrocinitomix mangrovi]